MKPTVPETGEVIKLEGDLAKVALRGSGACKSCSAGQLGLCKPTGNMSVLIAKNILNAKVGDTVIVGVDRSVQTRGFLLAFIIPLSCFIIGAIIGYFLNKRLSIPSLEVIAGFIALLCSAFLTFRRLKIIDSTSQMAITDIISDKSFSTEFKTEEEKRFEASQNRT